MSLQGKPRLLQAQYAGRCVGCRRSIRVGAWIRFQGTHIIFHDGCHPGSLTVRSIVRDWPTSVCAECDREFTPLTKGAGGLCPECAARLYPDEHVTARTRAIEDDETTARAHTREARVEHAGTTTPAEQER